MRLHRLEVTALGPFAGTESVDFDALAAAGLFLFTGPTGAGKTSILDAICFALYGQVPGARAVGPGRSSLRSDHAADGVPPEVVLEITLRARRLRITRSPAWERPKRRGSGTVTEHAHVLVEEDTAAGRVVHTNRLDEAGQLLGDLLGLSLHQFCQVVLLPQGSFAEFLRADADRRRALLETLFDTRRFAEVEGWLVARRQVTARDVATLDDGLRQLIARVSEVAGEDPPSGLLDGLAGTEVTDWLEELDERAAAAEAATAEAAEVAAETARIAAATAADAERVAGLRVRAGTLRNRAATLASAQPGRDAAMAELAAARAVAPLIPLLAEAGRLQAELEDARAQAAAAHQRVVTVLADTGTSGPTVITERSVGTAAELPALTAVRSASRATADEASRLEVLVVQESEAAALVRTADQLQQTAVELAAKAAKDADWLAAAPARRSELAAARDNARSAAATLPAVTKDRDMAARRLEAGVQRDSAIEAVVAARDGLRVLVDRHQAARDRLQAMRATRLAGMAAELAAVLRPGADCPVCGSAEHPRPARSHGPVADAAAEEGAETAAALAEAARQEGDAVVARLEVELATHRAVAGGEQSTVELRAGLATAEAALLATAGEAARLGATEAALASFDREAEHRERDRVADESAQRSATARALDARSRAERLSAELAIARGDDPSITARRARLQRTAADLDGLVEHLTDVDRLAAAVAEALDRVESAVRAEGLRSVDEVLAAVRDPERLTELEELTRRHDAELAAVTEQLADPELTTALQAAEVDLAALHHRAGETAAARDRASAQAQAAATRVAGLARRAAEVVAAQDIRRPLAERHRLVDGLARLAEGKSADNALRMSLSAYVLAARLEQVAVSASDRLLRMSSGRYALVHSAQAAGGRARGGLSLRVLDAWTGRLRDPATLSGGETFSASLALALGLADVVTAEAGGALLETLFVDEGFGSLDEDSLDDVMGVLDDLRDGGRTVGIVSHVADLRQRVPVQLRVRRGRQGSTIEQ